MLPVLSVVCILKTKCQIIYLLYPNFEITALLSVELQDIFTHPFQKVYHSFARFVEIYTNNAHPNVCQTIYTHCGSLENQNILGHTDHTLHQCNWVYMDTGHQLGHTHAHLYPRGGSHKLLDENKNLKFSTQDSTYY